MNDQRILSPNDTADELVGTQFVHADEQLVGAYATADFASAVRLLDAVAVAADEANHHPDVKLGWGRVEFELSSHDAGGDTSRDAALARRITAIAAEQGAKPGN